MQNLNTEEQMISNLVWLSNEQNFSNKLFSVVTKAEYEEGKGRNVDILAFRLRSQYLYVAQESDIATCRRRRYMNVRRVITLLKA